MRQVVRIDIVKRASRLCALLLVTGCSPPQVLQFTPSADLRSMTDGVEDAQERETLQKLQKQIETEMAQRFGTPTAPLAFGDPKASREALDTLKKGAEVYAYRCQQCHGVNGDGKGAVADYLAPRPRDYTKGIFKFTSTPYGSKPRHSDLVRTLQAGIRGTAMPAFDELDPGDLEAVSEYVIYLSERGELQQQLVALAKDELALPPETIQSTIDTIAGRWKEAQSQAVMPLTPMPAMTPDTIAKGHDLFLQQVCNKCHGIDGRGGLAGGIDIGVDSWGQKGAAADLTSGMYRGGGRPIDIYRRIYSGINGTPMPGFSQVFAKDPESIWYLVHYVRDIGERRRRNQAPPKDGGVLSPPSTVGKDLIAPGALPSEAGKTGDPAPGGLVLPGETPDATLPPKPAADPKAMAEKKAAEEKKAADEKKAAEEKKAADEKKAAEEKKAADDNKASEEKKEGEVKKEGGEKKEATEEKPAAEEKKSGTDEKKEGSEEKPATEEKKPGTEEKSAGEEKPAKEEKPAPEEKPAGEEKSSTESEG